MQECTCMEHVPNMFMSFDKYLFLEVINILIQIGLFKESETQLFQKISEAYLGREVFGHIGFEAKQEMKPYYNIVHKAFQAAILTKLRQFFFQDGVTHVTDNTEYKMF